MSVENLSHNPHNFIQDPTKNEPLCFLCGARKESHVVYASQQETASPNHEEKKEEGNKKNE